VPSPTLQATRQAGGWVVGVPGTGAVLPQSPLLDACLAAFDGGATVAAARRVLTAWPPPVVASLVQVLQDLGFLVPADQQREVWSAWGPEAEAFHFATRDVRFARGARRRPPPPSPITRRQARARMPLPLPALPPVGLEDALRARRTWRRMTGGSLTLEQLGTLLGLTFGVQAWADAPAAGWSALKTSPSGGARHSLEAYVCVRRVHGLPAGLYHYRPDVHRLDLLRPGCSAGDIGRFLPNQSGYRRASVVCAMASVLDRVRWRYPHGRAYRVVLMEAGHLAQTFALVATALGLASFTTGALADTVIEEAFGLSARHTPVLQVVGAGVRPPGVSWAPYADAPPPALRRTRLGGGPGTL
jgi:SagB-type dehydrogenase family enzyme